MKRKEGEKSRKRRTRGKYNIKWNYYFVLYVLEGF